MKKVFLIFTVCLGISAWASPALAASDFWEGVGAMGQEIFGEITGQGVPEGKFELPPSESFNQIGENTSARGYILNVLNFALSFLGIIAVAMIIYAGFLYVTASGDDGQSEKAKNIVMYAAIGILVILVSYALVNTLITQAGRGGDDRGECGNGILEIGEMCDNGEANVTGVEGACPTTCRTICGNSIKEFGEECDDGNRLNGDECSATCKTGDGAEEISSNGGGVSDVSSNISITSATGGASDFGTNIFVSLAGAQEGEGLTFDLNIGDVSSVLWNFGDGIQKELTGTSTTTHRYGSEKTYVIKVLAENSNGDKFIGSKNLVVGGIQAQFSSSPVEIMKGDIVTFNAAQSKTSVGSIVDYRWSCGGGGGCFPSGTGKQYNVTFTEAGQYSVTLEVETNIGAKQSISKDIEVLNNKPIANFICTKSTNSLTPADYTCDASESKNITGTLTGLVYLWDVAGEAKTTATPFLSGTFNFPGDKTVSLTVTQVRQGEVLESDPFSFTILNVKTLGVDFNAPSYPLIKGVEFTFSASGTPAETYKWTFPAEAAIPATDPLLNFPSVKTYFNTVGGPYQVALTVTKGTESNTITKNVYVREEGQFMAIPEVTINGQIFQDPTTVTLNRKDTRSFASKSIDEFGEFSPSSNMTETWSVDGSIISDPAQISPKFTQVKNYSVSLKVSRPGNPNVGDTASFQVVVENINPQVSSVTEDHTNLNNVQVTANATDEDGTIQKYTFRLLEAGQIKQTQIVTENIAYFNISSEGGGEHTFLFEVLVEDDNGGTATQKTNPFIVNIPATNTAPQLGSIAVSPSLKVGVNDDVFFTINVQDNEGDALSYTWDFGDGNTFEGQLGAAPGLRTITTSHSYPTIESYTVNVTVDDNMAPPVISNSVNVRVMQLAP
ncbi:PKD domain-containing protein [Candidatus Gracilibacteria bacterium]|nr:PKD domain-containing protein [Candidatus Gracilibacteria bacterium]